MTKTKLALATAIAAVLAFGVAACGPKAETTTTEAPAVTEPAASTEAPAVDTSAVTPVDPAATAPATTTTTTTPAPAPAPAPAPEKH